MIPRSSNGTDGRLDNGPDTCIIYTRRLLAVVFLASGQDSARTPPVDCSHVFVGLRFDHSRWHRQLRFWRRQLFGGITGTAQRSFRDVVCGSGRWKELCKFGAVRLGAYRSLYFDEPVDGLVYASAASLGFASLENLFYVLQYGPEVMLLRAPLSTVAHLVFGSIWGQALGQFYVSGGRRAALLYGLSCRGGRSARPVQRYGFLLSPGRSGSDGLWWVLDLPGLSSWAVDLPLSISKELCSCTL